MTAAGPPAGNPLLEPALSEEEWTALRKGVEEFNDGYFFECHDTLEDAWSGIRGPGRDFFQGLIQVSVGFYHWRNGNAGGASTMLRRGLGRLSRYRPTYYGLDLERLVPEVDACGERIRSGDAFPEDRALLPLFRLG